MKLQLSTILNMLPLDERLKYIKTLLYNIRDTTTLDHVKAATNRHLQALELYEKRRKGGLNNDYT